MGIAEKVLMEFHALKTYNLPIKEGPLPLIYGALLGVVMVFVSACVLYSL